MLVVVVVVVASSSVVVSLKRNKSISSGYICFLFFCFLFPTHVLYILLAILGRIGLGNFHDSWANVGV